MSIDYKHRNREVLLDFVRYCMEHPEERFWQALRNWAGYPFIFAANEKDLDNPSKNLKDTFYWEHRDR